MKPTKESLAFRKANRQRRKVMIAKDVIKWIKASKIVPDHGHGYLWTDAVPSGLSKSKDLRALVKKSKEPCMVCAIGAVFCAAVLKNDKFNTDSKYVTKEPMVEYLKNVFSAIELNEIESAYEGFREKTMYQRIDDSSTRVIVMMNNIIRNKGNFVYGDPKDFE